VSFLQAGEVLLHIGPPKTGTTALQQSMSQARPQMKAQGVLYPGKRFSHWTPSCSALGIATTAHPADPPVPPEVWTKFAARVGRRKDRAVVSSEQFADASPEVAARIVDDLGGRDTAIVVVGHAVSVGADIAHHHQITRRYAFWQMCVGNLVIGILADLTAYSRLDSGVV
jgi:hypothetical protein